MRWAGDVVRMGNRKRAHKVLVGKPEGTRPLGRPLKFWINCIKIERRGLWASNTNERSKGLVQLKHFPVRAVSPVQPPLYFPLSEPVTSEDRARWIVLREIHFCFDLVWKICCIVTITTHNWLVFCMHVDKMSIGRILYIFSSCVWNQIAGRILLVADLSYWQRRLAINKTKCLYGICGGQSRFGVGTFSSMYLGFCLLVHTPYPVCVESIFKSTLPPFIEMSLLHSQIRAAWPLKMGLIGCPETSVTNHYSTLRNIAEERRCLQRVVAWNHAELTFACGECKINYCGL